MSSSKKGPRQRQARAVLSEEEYTDTLSDIVQRDYYPELPALRRQVAVLDRRAAGDFPGAVAVRRAARQLEEHEEALAEEEHEAEHDTLHNIRRTARPLHRETVTGFHARVTSEDNYEFEQTQQAEVKASRERLQQVFSNRLLTDSSSQRRQVSETPLLASDKYTAPAHRIEASEWKDTGTNGLFFTPQHVVPGSANEEAKLLTNGKAAENQLMPPPASVKRKDTESSLPLVLKQDLVEYIPKSTDTSEKRIEPSQTRFSTALSLPNQTLVTHGGDDSSTDYSTEASTDLDAPMRPLAVERQARAKRQKREQQTYVTMTPMIEPRASGNESPIVTWGTVSGTPMVLGGMDTADTVVPERSFTIPKESERDNAARRAEAKLEKARRKTKQQRKRSSGATPLDRATASLTPAAQSLLEKATQQRPSSVRSSSAFSSALRSSYTPKRMASRDSTNSGKATPRISKSEKKRPAMPMNRDKASLPKGNVTDGLLNLPTS